MVTFFLFSRASEFLDTQGRFHLVSIFVLLGVIALVMAGTIPQVVRSRPGVWVSAFTAWLTFSLPFSMWRGGSFASFTGIWLKSVIFFFLIAGLVFTVQQFRTLIFWLAMSTLSVMYYTIRTGAAAGDDRFSVTYGTLGNSNDLAGSLLMGVPFLLYVAVDKRRNALIRTMCGVMTLGLLAMVFRTGSRGSLIACAFLAILAFLKANAANKMKILVVTGIAVVCFPFVVSKGLMARYATILESDENASSSSDVNSAIESSNARRGLMKQGLWLTLYHPVFGVGLGQFSNQSADLFIARGEKPMWFTCHDIFLLVSSETGLPGFFCYMAIIVVCYKALVRLQRAGKASPSLKEVSDLAFCVMLSLTAFVACGIFSTNAYSFQLPVLAALTAALDRVSQPSIAAAVQAHFQLASQNAAPVAPRFRTRPAPPVIA